MSVDVMKLPISVLTFFVAMGDSFIGEENVIPTFGNIVFEIQGRTASNTCVNDILNEIKKMDNNIENNLGATQWSCCFFSMHRDGFESWRKKKNHEKNMRPTIFANHCLRYRGDVDTVEHSSVLQILEQTVSHLVTMRAKQLVSNIIMSLFYRCIVN